MPSRPLHRLEETRVRVRIQAGENGVGILAAQLDHEVRVVGLGDVHEVDARLVDIVLMQRIEQCLLRRLDEVQVHQHDGRGLEPEKR